MCHRHTDRSLASVVMLAGFGLNWDQAATENKKKKVRECQLFIGKVIRMQTSLASVCSSQLLLQQAMVRNSFCWARLDIHQANFPESGSGWGATQARAQCIMGRIPAWWAVRMIMKQINWTMKGSYGGLSFENRSQRSHPPLTNIHPRRLQCVHRNLRYVQYLLINGRSEPFGVYW
jgi:hypothetical protein